MENTGEASWSEKVEDLVAAGDTRAAITFLEDLISEIQTNSSDDLRLASALSDLASLYSSTGFSLKSDELLSRASLLKHRAKSSSAGLKNTDLKEDSLTSPNLSLDANDNPLTHGNLGKLPVLPDDCLPPNSPSDDDWEAIADREPNELLSSECLPGVSKLSLEDSKAEAPKRRGRGTFSYKRNELYSDQLCVMPAPEDTENEDVGKHPETKAMESKYSTHHVLVLADFSPSTRTQDLEKLFENFKDRGFAIRWVNDTTALAVFRTPSIDLEPPRQRPQTSARTAQRLIAQAIGSKLPSTFGSRELRNQEEARRNRIVSRQKLRDDAWGDD